MENQREDIENIKQILARNKKSLLAFTNVTGVGIGYKEPKSENTSLLCIRVYVVKKLPLTQLRENEIIPKFIENITTDVIETGIPVAG